MLLFQLILSNTHLFGFTISGKVTDDKGNPLPFATLYISGTTKGTTTNIEGQYIFELPAGNYELIFQYVGYQKSTYQVDISDRSVKLDVVLKRESFQLKEVVINAKKGDPAYEVIRNAIKKRKYHKEEVQAYKCYVYIKGMQTLTEKPDKLLGYTIPVDTGIVYLSESISELSVEQPDKIKEVMISSKVSGNIATFSYNQGSQMLVSFYDNLVKVNGLSERSFVSPISTNALLFYDYTMEGVNTENDLIINKIRVIPKRKNDPTFEGFIYIIEDTWRIHSLDLTLTKDHQIEFMNRMTLHQVYAPVQNDIWMMISQKFNYELNAFGFKGEGNFIGVHSDYIIQPKEKAFSNDSLDTSVIKTSLFPKKYFTNEILTIEDGSNKKDTVYWNAIRPIPLTAIEKADYHNNDSLKTIYESKAYKDSVDNKLNKISISNILYSGFTYQKSFEEKYYSFDPLIQNIQYNTVEGWVVDISPTYTKLENSVLKYRLSPNLRYGFSSEKFYAKIRGDIFFNPKNFSKAYIDFGRFVSQMNEGNTIKPAINTFETLMRSNNYAKLSEKSYFKFLYQSEINSGIFFRTSLEYAQKLQLNNTDNLTLFGDNDLTSNQPINTELTNTSFDTYKSLIYFLKLRFDIKRKYATRPDGKILFESSYPRFEFYYRKAIPTFGGNADYDYVEGLVAGDIPLGLVGQGEYAASVGGFISKKNVPFPEYQHFNTDEALVSNFSLHRFQLLDYYKFSSTSRFVKFNYRHHFNGFLINKIPFFRKSKVQTVASLSYLNTTALGNYFEYGIGLEHILKVLRVDYYASNIDGKFYRHGIRIGIGF